MISQITERPLVNCVLFADYLLECADDEFDRAFCCADNEILDADDEVDYPAVTERAMIVPALRTAPQIEHSCRAALLNFVASLSVFQT